MSAFKSFMGSRPVVELVRIGATVALAITLIAAGFLACLLPVSTDALANATVATNLSPFSHDELVKGANATRDYSFTTHDKHAMLATIYEMNQSLPQAPSTSVWQSTRPKVDASLNPQDMSTEELEKVLLTSNVAYSFDQGSFSHLDDVYNIASKAYIAIAIIFILLIASIAHVVYYRGWRETANIFCIAGIMLIALLAIAGAWAAIDFYGFFQMFHTLFFSGDSWIFPYDCLLICMLPEDFWMGMGIIWLSVTMVLSILSVIIGFLLRKKSATAKE